MRGILIDPFTKTVTDIATNGDIDSIYAILKCEVFTIVSVGDDDLFLDDEGLFVPKEDQEYWTLIGNDQIYAGRGLILGHDEEGNTKDAATPLLAVKCYVGFLHKEPIDPEELMESFIWVNGQWEKL